MKPDLPVDIRAVSPEQAGAMLLERLDHHF
jgi:hypothetical protein